MRPATALAQLRHAYAQLAAGTVVDQKAFADGLLPPAIAALEAVPAPSDHEKPIPTQVADLLDDFAALDRAEKLVAELIGALEKIEWGQVLSVAAATARGALARARQK